MSVVKGKDVVLFHAGKAVACARSVTFNTTTSLIETTTKGTGKGATYKPQKNNTTASLEGVVYLPDAAKYTLPDLRQGQLNHVLYNDATIVRTSLDGLNVYTDTFDFYITSISDTGSVGDFNTFQMEMQVNGDPVISTVYGGCAPMNVTWQTVNNGNGTQTITFNFTPGANSGSVTISRSNDGATYAFPSPGLNTSPRTYTAPLGVYFIKMESVLGCIDEIIIPNVGTN